MAEVQRADLSIYGNLNTQKPMSLADMLNIGKQTYELSKMKELYPSVIAEQQAKSRIAQVGANVAEQTGPLEVVTKQQTTESGGIDLATKKQNSIANGYVSKIFDPMIVNAAKNPDSVNRNQLVENVKKWGLQQGREAGIDEAKSLELIQPYIEIAQNNPGQLQDYLKQRHILGLTPQSRTSALAPSGIQVSTGAGGATVNTNPFAGMQEGQAIPGTTFIQQLPPTTPIQTPTGEGTYLGAAPQGTPIVSSQGPMFQNQANLATKDWTETTAAQQEAANRIPVIQNIKKLAPEAFTGVGGARKELAAGILGAVGIDILTAEKTSTDELSKNAAILQLAGGNTDLARTIAEAANPNKKMTKEAIEGMANQLLGVEKLKQARYDYLKPFVNDPIKFNEKSAQFAKFADYRLFQEMTADEVAKLKQSMSPAQQKEVSNKIKEAKMLGIIR
jgi:hypothetical protein